MPKIEISGTKGLVQSTGAARFGQAAVPGGYGKYQYVREIDFGGYTCTSTDNGLIKTICRLPDNAHIIRFDILCTEASSASANVDIDFVTCAASDNHAADDAITASTTFIATYVMETGGGGDLNALTQVPHADGDGKKDLIVAITEQDVVIINRGGSNSGTLTSGKLLVLIEYIGNGSAEDLAQV